MASICESLRKMKVYKMKISFVIPCYRSEQTIEGVVAEIKEVVSQRPDVAYEVIMVCDHSPDNVYSVIERMCAADPDHLRGVLLSKNFGQQAALMAGYSRASGDLMFALDDDGQAPVDSIWRLIDEMLTNAYDVVYGTYPKKKHNFFRNIGSNINHLMGVWLVGKPKNLHTTSFNVACRYVIDEILKYRGPYAYIGGLFFRITKNIGKIEVRHRKRASGTSGYTFTKLLGLWMNGFTAFSVKPLRLATWVGVLCAGIGFFSGIWIVLNKLFIAPNVPMGYSSMMAALLFIGGMLMLMLGLIGEYIGRIYICINQSPQYVVSKETKTPSGVK